MLNLLLISIPFLFVLGVILHFAYGLSKKNLIVGLFSPVNESVFEHSKLLLVPLVLFWLTSYFFLKNIDVNNYFFAMLVSIVFSIMFMISFYYTYKEIIGNRYFFIDVLDLLLALFIGQLLANHIYEYGKGIPFIASISLIAVIFISYVYLTFKPFKLPLFYDEKNKIYGIKKK